MRCSHRNSPTATAPPRCRSRSTCPKPAGCSAVSPKRGDVVVFRWPGDRSQAWVKRVVGLPGDRIQMRQGQLFINDRAASLKADGIGEVEDERGEYEPARRYIETLPGGVSHAIFKIRDNGRLDNTPEVTVPAGYLFVMGDNRDNSADSRVPLRDGGVGLLPIDDLVGRADAVIGSWDLGIREPAGLDVAVRLPSRAFLHLRPLRARLFAACAPAVLLDRRARHRAVGTEHAAIAWLSVSAFHRNPCIHRNTGRHRAAFARWLESRISGMSTSIPVASPFHLRTNFPLSRTTSSIE